VINAIAEARAQGDLSEKRRVRRRQRSAGFSSKAGSRKSIASCPAAQIIDPTALDAGGKVVFGRQVELQDEASGERREIPDRGEDEADLKLGLIKTSAARSRAP